SSFCENSGSDISNVEELIPKKDKLVGHSAKVALNGPEEKEDFDILEGDIQKSFVNGIPSISFTNRIHQILIQGMDNTVILKLLGRNIGFSILQNKIYSLWKPSVPVHMMDIENGYFLVQFQNKLDCKRPLSEEIGEIVRKVVKLDMNTDSRVRGCFARMAIYVNFEKPLVSKILINGRSQKVEYESLPTICFHCGRYGHVEGICTFRKPGPTVEKEID
ncbi:hypothetical protein Gorai_016465, partial [Gossypium raimondii]|nr:hypothetical protein [Gossypium raimondii]